MIAECTIQLRNPASVLGYYLGRITGQDDVWCVCCVDSPIDVLPICRLLSIHHGKHEAIFEYAVLTLAWKRVHGKVHRLAVKPVHVGIDDVEPPWPDWLKEHLEQCA